LKDKIDYEMLTPDVLITAVEEATGCPMTGLTYSLPSYINRVYELQAEDETRMIAKFYRPGRWTREAIQDEHDFVMNCFLEEIPVVAPLKLKNGETIGEADGIFFSVFPRRHGRGFEVNSDEDWLRIGRLIGRVHAASGTGKAENRIRLSPETSTVADIDQLLKGGFISDYCFEGFKDICMKILDRISGVFDDAEFIRIHGDCHQGNLIDRPDEGLMLIDFDDMMMGPPVQDLWLLLPDYANFSRREMNLMIEGYEHFRNFDRSSLKLIEPLRAMRIIYFLAWCSTQSNDYKFKTNFPEWGSDNFWLREIEDLNLQLKVIIEHESSY